MGTRAEGSVSNSGAHAILMDIKDEDESELGLENLEDFEKEPIESVRVSRCKTCRRLNMVI